MNFKSQVERLERKFIQMKQRIMDIPIEVQFIDANSRYIMYNIYLFDKRVHLTFFAGRSGLPNFLRIEDYFSSHKKSQQLPTRRAIFEVIDRIALALDCVLTYVDQDTHNYTNPARDHMIPSRDIDTLAGDVTFYQRAWPDSVVANPAQIGAILYGQQTQQQKPTKQSICGRAATFRQEWRKTLPTQIRQEALELRKALLQDPSHQNIQTCTRFFKKIQDMPNHPKLFKMWRQMTRGDTFDTVVKFY